MSEIRPRLAFVVLAALLSVLLRNDVGAQGRQVDLALVLAIDCSFSVDANEFRLQMEGIGKAFLEPDVKTAIRNAFVQRSEHVRQLGAAGDRRRRR